MRQSDLLEEFAAKWEARRADYQNDYRKTLNSQIDDSQFVSDAGPHFETLVRDIEPTATLIQLNDKLIITRGKNVEDVVSVYKSQYRQVTAYCIAAAWMYAHMHLITDTKPTLKELIS